MSASKAIKVLERRRTHLTDTLLPQGRALHYIKAEISALTVAIDSLKKESPDA